MSIGTTLCNDGRKAHVCNICGKEDKGHNIKQHIEGNHIEGIIIPCNLCEKVFRTRTLLKKHNVRYHKGSTTEYYRIIV